MTTLSMHPGLVLSTLALGALVVLLAAALLQWLWNITMPEVFGLRPIRFWVAFRLLLITGLLTGPLYQASFKH